MMDLMGIVFSLAMQVKEKVELVEANKSQCQRLAERIDIVIESIRGLETLPDSENFKQGLKALESCLYNCIELVDTFNKKKRFEFARKILNAGTHSDDFKAANNKLEKAMNLLQLGLNIQQIMNREQDKADQQADLASIHAQQTEILKLNQEQNEKLQEMSQNTAEGHELLMKQLSSMRLRFDQMSSPKLRAEIDPKLMIPFYELIFKHQIGKGSFGQVYLAHWQSQAVAVKRIEHLTDATRKEFIREINITSRLHHPRIVQLIGACTEPDRACILLEYMSQGSLEHYLSSHPVSSLSEQKKLALEIAQGMIYLHSRGVIHRDVKSANILIDEDGHAKVSDFGLAKIHSHSVHSAASRSEAIAWMAPELRTINPTYTTHSDVYAYGVVLWEIATGKKPYEGREITSPSDIEGKKPGKLNGISCEALRRLIEVCWSRVPEQRPSFEEIIPQIEAIHDRPPSPDAESYYLQAKAEEAAGNFTAAYKHYEASARKHYWKGYFRSALMTLQGGLGGAPSNKREAYRKLKIAADNGHLPSKYNQARMVEKGDGIPEDLSEALQLYQEIASEEHTELGKSYPDDVKYAKEKVIKLEEQLALITIIAPFH